MEAEPLWAQVSWQDGQWDVWKDEIASCLAEFCSICLCTFRSDGPTLVLSFPPLSEVGNVNGFYLMFFLLTHSPIWSPICQCHPRLWLSEFSFARQTLLFSSLLMMLMVVMDCMNGNLFTGPCSSSASIEVLRWNAALRSRRHPRNGVLKLNFLGVPSI